MLLYARKGKDFLFMKQNTSISPEGRYLTEAEIVRLQAQGCTASDWTAITIHPETDLGHVSHVRFIGHNRLGRFDKTHELPGGIRQHAGAHHATLCETTVGNDCLIMGITGCISRYDIGEGCVILNTDTLCTEGRTSFGQGVEIAVLSETGGREIIMHGQLSVHEAYMQAMYRHDAKLVRCLRTLAKEEAGKVESERGRVGEGSRIVRCGMLRNVLVGEACHIEGTARLENGTICSRKEAPTYVGEGVIAKDFIIQSGCHVADGVMLTRCYVGQASVIGHGFSASDVYFGCNCQAEHGEACAVFAGPYTVTHHKSTLLIGGMFSFMNAGSGTNQSNHMYKLGPSHQGILERGCKTASGSHILWPARAGAFSMVMGHYAAHADTALFPFSYLVEHSGNNYLIPGITLRNVGTFRDIQKWPQRDHRPSSVPSLDHIVFDAGSPYTMGKMLRALPLLEEWETLMPEGCDEWSWKGLRLKKKAIRNGQSFYRLALSRFIGRQLLKRLQACAGRLPKDLYASMQPAEAYCETWCDMGGLLAPSTEIQRLVEDIKEGRVPSIEAFLTRTLYIYTHYEEYAWAWTWHQIKERFTDMYAGLFAKEVCLPLLREWKEAEAELNAQIIADAGKEFAPIARVGFGIDGDETTADEDFLAVRGGPESHSVIKELRRRQDEIQQTYSAWENTLTR